MIFFILFLTDALLFSLCASALSYDDKKTEEVAQLFQKRSPDYILRTVLHSTTNATLAKRYNRYARILRGTSYETLLDAVAINIFIDKTQDPQPLAYQLASLCTWGGFSFTRVPKHKENPDLQTLTLSGIMSRLEEKKEHYTEIIRRLKPKTVPRNNLLRFSPRRKGIASGDFATKFCGELANEKRLPKRLRDGGVKPPKSVHSRYAGRKFDVALDRYVGILAQAHMSPFDE
ncbi:MAG: hypothetical protein H6849_02645 [Alphaproteobacteria bacterium]|nr:MAG: hypothetical protein H6849_02645 [Alphaproteobacteria bacterium]